MRDEELREVDFDLDFVFNNQDDKNLWYCYGNKVKNKYHLTCNYKHILAQLNLNFNILWDRCKSIFILILALQASHKL